MAAGLVQRLGVADVIHVTGGGVPTWARAGYAVDSGADAPAPA